MVRTPTISLSPLFVMIPRHRRLDRILNETVKLIRFTAFAISVEEITFRFTFTLRKTLFGFFSDSRHNFKI